MCLQSSRVAAHADRKVLLKAGEWTLCLALATLLFRCTSTLLVTQEEIVGGFTEEGFYLWTKETVAVSSMRGSLGTPSAITSCTGASPLRPVRATATHCRHEVAAES